MIDTHTHLFDASFDDDRSQVIERAVSSGITKMILPAIDSQSHERLMEVAMAYPQRCYGAMGLHPTSVNDNPRWREELVMIEKYLQERPVEWVAVGEVGLDLYWSQDFYEQQLEAFVLQVELSIKHNLPLIIHTRNAWDEMMEAVKPYKGKIRGVFHSFSAEQRHLDTILEMGDFCVGIGGVVTYKKSTLPELVRQCPMEKILLETDSPYLPPVPYRGKRNESGYLGLVAAQIATIKGIPVEQVKKITTDNAMHLFFS